MADTSNANELGPASAQLLDYWVKSVAGFAHDTVTGRNPTDRTVHDLIAVLYARNELVGDLRADDRSRLQQADALYESVTIADPRSLGELVGDVSASTNHWWFRRVPKSGAIREEIDKIRAG
ncbi:hypothetical protein GCM10009543_19710 [Leifsonia naganoensis]